MLYVATEVNITEVNSQMESSVAAADWNAKLNVLSSLILNPTVESDPTLLIKSSKSTDRRRLNNLNI